MESYRYDKHQRVENSTKGKSDINPRTYKRDVLMQVWLQSRHLATLLKWLENSGTLVRFRSEIVQITLEQIVEHLVSTGAIEMVEYAEDAQRMLERFGVKSNPSGRGGKNAFHNLTLDSKKKDGKVGGYNPESRFIHEVNEGPSTEKIMHEFEYDKDEAERILKEITEKDIEKKAKEEKDRVLANCTYGEDIGEGERVIIPRAVKGNPDEEDMKAYEKREKARRRANEIDKRKKIIEKRKEKLNEEAYLIKEKEYEEGLIRGREGNSDEPEEEGSNTSKDSQ